MLQQRLEKVKPDINLLRDDYFPVAISKSSSKELSHTNTFCSAVHGTISDKSQKEMSSLGGGCPELMPHCLPSEGCVCSAFRYPLDASTFTTLGGFSSFLLFTRSQVEIS